MLASLEVWCLWKENRWHFYPPGLALTKVNTWKVQKEVSFHNHFFYRNAKYISLNYDVISEEPMEWVGSSFDDEFSAELLGSNGATLAVLAGESINSSTWLPLDGINFDGGDNTTYHTGWTSILNYDISSYAGQNVTLRFRVSDKGDSIYDTAAIVDGISISN